MKVILRSLALASVAFISLSSAQAAVLSGKINLKGTPPKATKINMSADAKCKELSKGEVYNEVIIANPNSTLKNAFVYVKTGLEGKKFPTPTTSVTIDQNTCHYIPHVFGAMVNQPVDILNSDPTLHNIHAMPVKSAQFNLGMPMKGMKMTRKFDKPEVMVKIKCDVHPWMKAYVGVLEHPFYAVSDDQGAYQIKDLPAGKYVVEAWHEKLGTKEMTLTVEEGKPATADFTFEVTEKGPAAKAE